MAKLGFRQFQGLIRQIETKKLFDAVKPELQDLAEIAYETVKKPEAYQTILNLAYLTCGGKGDPPVISNPSLLVQRMGAGRDGKGSYKTDRVNAERIYYYFLFNEDLDDPGYAQNIDYALFGESFFDKFSRQLRRWDVARPDYSGPVKKAHIGPLSIEFESVDGSTPLSIDAPGNHRLLDGNGSPEIYKALQWRFRLSKLRGRELEWDALVEWAFKPKDNLKVMLISGPGGSGKTRLAADFVSNLVQRHGWSGGFAILNKERMEPPLDGSGKGVAVIVDYPEENFEIVLRILEAAASQISRGCSFSKPIRILLVSREKNFFWQKHLRRALLDYVDELQLDDDPYLDLKSAVTAANDVIEDLPKRFAKEVKQPKGLLNWLKLHDSHRLPLNITAAAVHAVLDPQNAFTLDAKKVLSALALIESERVRSYSTRSLGHPDTLGRLLALSTLTIQGLKPATISLLGEVGFWQADKEVTLLDVLRETPFCLHVGQIDIEERVVRIEPDIFAVAFASHELFQRNDHRLPMWLDVVCRIQGSETEAVLLRYLFDLGKYSPICVERLEAAFLHMLEVTPESVLWIWRVALRESVLSTNLAIAALKRILEIVSDDGTSAYAASILTNHLANKGLKKEALHYAKQAVELYEKLAAKDCKMYLDDLARSKVNLSARLAEDGHTEPAVELGLQALEIHQVLLKEDRAKHAAGFATNSANLAGLVGVAQPQLALKLFDQAAGYFSVLASRDPANYKLNHGRVILDKAKLLTELGELQDVPGMVSLALDVIDGFMDDFPEIDFIGVAASRVQSAKLLLSLGELDAFCGLIERLWSDFASAALTSAPSLVRHAKEILARSFSAIDQAMNECGLEAEKGKLLISSLEIGWQTIQDAVLPRLSSQVLYDLPQSWVSEWHNQPIFEAEWQTAPRHLAAEVLARIDLAHGEKFTNGSFTRSHEIDNARFTNLDFGRPFQLYEFQVSVNKPDTEKMKGIVTILAGDGFSLLLEGDDNLPAVLANENIALTEKNAKSYLKLILCYCHLDDQPNRVIEKIEDIQFSVPLSLDDKTLISSALKPINRIVDADAAALGAMTFEATTVWHDIVRRMLFSLLPNGHVIPRDSADMFDCPVIVQDEYLGIYRFRKVSEARIGQQISL